MTRASRSEQMIGLRLSPSASITTTRVGVILRSDLGTFQLKGRDILLFTREIVPLLDGTRDREAIAHALAQYSPQSIFGFLDVLEQHQLIERGTITPEPQQQVRWCGQEDFFRKWTDKPEELTRRLRNARILIVGLEPWGVVTATELAAAGVGALHLLDDGKVMPEDLLLVRIWKSEYSGRPRSEALMEVLAQNAPWCHVTAGSPKVTGNGYLSLDDTQWDLIIGATAADDLLLLQSIARFAHKAGVISIFCHLDGLDAFVGPAVLPGQTACWNCCRLRQLANSDHPQSAHALQAALLSKRLEPRRRTYLAPMVSVPGQLLALEALKLISRYTTSRLPGQLLVHNLVTLETTFHTVIRMPWCQICGGASSDGRPQSGPVLNGGTARNGPQRLDEINDPDSLRKLLAGWVDERTGIIKYLVINTPGVTEPKLPITSTAMLASYTEGSYRAAEPEAGAGKGLSATEAMIGAVGEAIERYSAARYKKRDFCRAALNSMQGDVFDPRQLCLYNERQYNEPGFPFARFDPDRPVAWTQGYWLDSHKPVWLPVLPTYIDMHVPPEERFCQVTSNGLAAGSTIEDASLRALFEAIERDAFMLSWLCQRQGQKLMLDHTLNADLSEVIRQLKESGAEVELYLLDVGLAIPTVACIGFGDGKRWPGATVSLAAHASPGIAVRKAILEQGHVGPYIRRLMLDAKQHVPASAEEVHTLTDHALFYTPVERTQAFNFLRLGEKEPLPLADLKEPEHISLQSCIEHLSTAGIRVAVKDLTAPDIATSPFRVARVLGTYLQPIDFGFKLRRLANPRLQAMLVDQLNPYPHPLA